jgi:hypothetical protein
MKDVDSHVRQCSGVLPVTTAHPPPLSLLSLDFEAVHRDRRRDVVAARLTVADRGADTVTHGHVERAAADAAHNNLEVANEGLSAQARRSLAVAMGAGNVLPPPGPTA